MRTILFTSVFILITYIHHSHAAIQCYKCLFVPPLIYTNKSYHLCKDFDYSDKFIVDCPYSTFCITKTFSARIPSLINGTERDCANQKLEYQNNRNVERKWREEISIVEPYQEGCTTPDNKGLRSSNIKNCYCRGSLCNTSNTLSITNSLIISVIVLLPFSIC